MLLEPPGENARAKKKIVAESRRASVHTEFSPKPAIPPTRDGHMHGRQVIARFSHRTRMRREPVSLFISRGMPRMSALGQLPCQDSLTATDVPPFRARLGVKASGATARA